jgi:hypothetical protein
MVLSIARSVVTSLIVGTAILISASEGRADTTAEEKYTEATNQCATLVSGQQAFCMEEALTQYRIDSAKEQNKDIVVHYNYDTSNDTPEQVEARRSYNEAVDQCMTLGQGQQSFCVEEAHDKYRSALEN